MILGILIVLLLVFTTWLLVAPMRIEVDSQQQHVKFQWWGIGHARLFLLNNELLLRARIGPWVHTWHPMRWKRASRKTRKQSKKDHQRKRSMSLQRIKKILRSFSLNVLKLDLDTDDYVMNGYLYPLFAMIKRPNRQLQINYNGTTTLYVQLENRGYRLLRAFIG